MSVISKISIDQCRAQRPLQHLLHACHMPGRIGLRGVMHQCAGVGLQGGAGWGGGGVATPHGSGLHKASTKNRMVTIIIMTLCDYNVVL